MAIIKNNKSLITQNIQRKVFYKPINSNIQKLNTTNKAMTQIWFIQYAQNLSQYINFYGVVSTFGITPSYMYSVPLYFDSIQLPLTIKDTFSGDISIKKSKVNSESKPHRLLYNAIQSLVGVWFYEQNIIFTTVQLDLNRKYSCNLIYYTNDTLYTCTINGSDFKLTDNPTMTSQFDYTYISGIGLYNQNNQLLMIGSLSSPIKNKQGQQLLLRIKLQV